MSGKNQKARGSIVHITVIIVVVLAVLGLLGFVFWKNFLTSEQSTASTSTQEQVDEQDVEEPTYTKGIVTPSQADIWAGYVAIYHVFTSVEGRSKVPKITCKTTQDAYAAWVGFDGFGGQTVEQIGFTAGCDDASNYVKASPIDGATYYAWAMMFGAGDSDVFDLPIRPGDVIFYKITYNEGSYDMQITNETVNQTVKKSYECKIIGNQGDNPCARTQAEWIVERPGNSSLAKFDDVLLYDNKATTDDGQTLYADGFDTYRLDMIQKATTLAKTNEFEGNGNFKVKWLTTGVAGLVE